MTSGCFSCVRACQRERERERERERREGEIACNTHKRERERKQRGSRARKGNQRPGQVRAQFQKSRSPTCQTLRRCGGSPSRWVRPLARLHPEAVGGCGHEAPAQGGRQSTRQTHQRLDRGPSKSCRAKNCMSAIPPDLTPAVRHRRHRGGPRGLGPEGWRSSACVCTTRKNLFSKVAVFLGVFNDNVKHVGPYRLLLVLKSACHRHRHRHAHACTHPSTRARHTHACTHPSTRTHAHASVKAQARAK